MNWSQLPQASLMATNEWLEKLKDHDVATYEHCLRVSSQSLFLAKAAGLSGYEQSLAHISGLLHDVGKLKIPTEILNKPGRLTEAEYELMKHHALYSAELIEPIAERYSFFKEVQQAILHHHERVDGQGYPFALSAEEIPLIAKVILIVDTVDAMTADRAYRKGLSMDVVYKELRQFAGKQFDATLVDIFIKAHKGFKGFAREPVSVVPLSSFKKAASF